MKKQVYEIDSNGYIVETHVKDITEALPENIVSIDPPDGLYRAKWTGTEWVEDIPQEEIDALNNVPVQETPAEKIVRLETQIQDISIALAELKGMGV